jgi:hypothetical protein
MCAVEEIIGPWVVQFSEKQKPELKPWIRCDGRGRYAYIEVSKPRYSLDAYIRVLFYHLSLSRVPAHYSLLILIAWRFDRKIDCWMIGLSRSVSRGHVTTTRTQATGTGGSFASLTGTEASTHPPFFAKG